MGITKPPAYEHPRKRARQGLVRPEPSCPASVAANEPIKKKKDEKVVLATSPAKALKGDTPTVQMRLVVHPPLAGQLPLYDKMIESGLVPKEVILGLLRKGFADFKSDLMSGRDTKNKIKFQTSGNAIETTRSISPAFIQKAKAHFDPFGVLTDRALGKQIGEAILSRVGKEDGHDC